MSYRIDEGLQIRRQQEEAYQQALSQYRGTAGLSELAAIGLVGSGNMGIQQALQAQHNSHISAAVHNSHISAAVPEQKPKKLLLLL